MSENWVNFTAAEVMGEDAAEREMIAGIKKRDDLEEICGQVVSQVRQAYAFANRDLGAEGMIPEGIKLRAVAIALWRFVSEGVPKNVVIQTKERQEAASAAVKFLDAIASGEMGRVSAPSVAERTRRFGDCEQDGI